MTLFTLPLLLMMQINPAPAPPSAPPPAPEIAPTRPLSQLPGPRTFGVIDQARFDACHDAAIADAATGVVTANQWLMEGGTFLARQCLGFAYARQGVFPAATATFVRAAEEAALARDWRAANLWAQAGNAALAGGDAAAAREHLNAALVAGTLTGVPLGEAHLDRARAGLVLGDMAGARRDLDLATRHAAEDPLVWLLSATLARRQDDLARAQADIAVAAQLGPRDAAIALEAGNIAAAGDRLEVAERQWQTAVTLGGATPPAVAARARLAELAAFREAELTDSHTRTIVPNPQLIDVPVATVRPADVAATAEPATPPAPIQPR